MENLKDYKKICDFEKCEKEFGNIVYMLRFVGYFCCQVKWFCSQKCRGNYIKENREIICDVTKQWEIPKPKWIDDSKTEKECEDYEWIYHYEHNYNDESDLKDCDSCIFFTMTEQGSVKCDRGHF